LKRSGASTSVVAGLFIVGLLVGAGVVYIAAPSIVPASTTTQVSTATTTVSTGSGAAAPASCGATPTGGTAEAWTTQAYTPSGSGLSGTITIGVLSDLSDGLSSEGLRVQAYTEQAATDINTWLQTTQWAGKVHFAVDVVDYGGSTTTASQDLATLASNGVAAVVGPLSSGIVGAIYEQAASDHVVLISPSSTSPAYYGASPYLYRTAPNDVFQGAADSCMLLSQGVKGVVIVYRDDTYGYGLYNYTSADFAASGSGVKVDAVPYSTTLEGETEFSSVATTLNTDYTALVNQYGASHTAIMLISFEEAGYLLEAVQSAYPTLLHSPQPWYGTDGLQGDTAMTNSTYGALMQDIRMPASVFGYTNSSKTAALCAEFTNPSLSCDSYALGSYDDVWLAALSILNCGANSGVCVSNVLPQVANSYFGVTGWTQLQTPTGVGGDRKGGDFQIWCVETPAGASGPNWYLCGDWSSQTNSVSWLSTATVPNP
jgi:branched-chain amino acid transport system substrate-binding protein